MSKQNNKRAPKTVHINEITVISPSQFTSKLWENQNYLPHSALEVKEHAQIIYVGEPNQNKTNESQPLNVAFLGHPVFHKGWEEWTKLVGMFSDNDLFKFYHFGITTDKSLSHRFVRTSVSRNNRYAMVDGLKKHSIDICFLWSIWPETFSFTLYESMAAGCYILTHKDSGNIQFTVKRLKIGEAFGSVEEMMKRINTSSFIQDVRRYRGQSESGNLIFRLNEPKFN